MDLPSLLMAGSLDTLTSYFSVAFLVMFLPVSVVVYACYTAESEKVFSAYCKLCVLLAHKRRVNLLSDFDNNGRSLFRLMA